MVRVAIVHYETSKWSHCRSLCECAWEFLFLRLSTCRWTIRLQRSLSTTRHTRPSSNTSTCDRNGCKLFETRIFCVLYMSTQKTTLLISSRRSWASRTSLDFDQWLWNQRRHRSEGVIWNLPDCYVRSLMAHFRPQHRRPRSMGNSAPDPGRCIHLDSFCSHKNRPFGPILQ